SSPSPLWGGTKGGGGNHSRPLNPKNPHLNRIRPPESRGYRPCRDARRTGSTAGGTGRSIHVAQLENVKCRLLIFPPSIAPPSASTACSIGSIRSAPRKRSPIRPIIS